MEDRIKAVLPQQAIAWIRAWRHGASLRRAAAQRRHGWDRMLRNWRQQQTRAFPSRGQDTPRAPRILLFPPDPRSIVGSRGDDAMIHAVVQQAREAMPGTTIDLFCEEGSEAIAASLGFGPVPIAADCDFAAAVAQLLGDRQYTGYMALGADILDGRFGARLPALMLIAADLAARASIPATILGSSFGTEPVADLRPVLRRLDRRVGLHMRDPVSLRRIEAFASVRPTLVADAAFVLQPGRVDPDVEAAIAQLRRSGRKVIGVNVHPMLLRDPGTAHMEQLTVGLCEALRRVSARQHVSWVLLPHDYREGFGDLPCLRELLRRMQAHPEVDVRLLEGGEGAADLKALTGCLDAVITGRMHLAIAALGMGVPVLGFAYNDKFEGLWAHFGLPQALLLRPAVLDDPAELERQIEDFLGALASHAAAIEAARSRVMELAKRNFVFAREGTS